MTDLIDRLKAASEGSAELDVAIAWLLRTPGDNVITHLDNYTQSIDAAVTLVPEGVDHCLMRLRNKSVAWVGTGETQRAATPALALCIAALLAREAVT